VVSYQGQVMVDGAAYDGTGYFKFAIVNQAGNTTYWSNDGTSTGGGEPTNAVQLVVTDGLFNVLLGDTTLPNMTQALGATVFSGTDRYLRVWFGSDSTTFTLLTPDRRIAAVPYALQAKNAATLTVQSAADDGTAVPGNCPGAGCRLRDAMAAAAPGDTITFDGDYTIYLASTLTIAKDLTIDGGIHSITISGNKDGAGDTNPLNNVPVCAIDSGVTVNLQNLTIADGLTTSGTGAGINNLGQLTVINSTFTANLATWTGFGGAIANGSGATVEITGSTFDGNQGNGAGALLNNGGTMMVSTSVFTNNSASAVWGGGGAIWNAGGTLTVTDSTFTGNTTLSGDGGAITSGGASGSTGTSTVTGSTFKNNSTSGNGGALAASYAAPLPITATNNTFQGNSATGTGGAFYASANSVALTITLTNNTFAENTAPSGGNLYLEQVNQIFGGSLTANLYNNILVKGATGGNCVFYGDVSTPTPAASHNLADDDTCGTGFTNSSTILLGPLGDYGGSTQTFPLLPGSSAIDAGDNATCAAAPVNGLDQRGVARPQGAHCDIGAYESRGFTLTKTGGDNQSTPINTAFPSALEATLTETGGNPLPGAAITFTPPGSGASAVITGSPATTNGSGAASVTATENGTTGAYNVTASAAGAASVNFALTNLATYTVTYNANGATGGTVPADQTKTYGVALTLATNTGSLVKTNYTFNGWNTQADGLGAHYAAGGTYTVNAAVTLYAEWLPKPVVTITSAASDPTSTSPIPVTLTFDQPVSGLTLGDLAVGNGAASNLATFGAGVSLPYTQVSAGAYHSCGLASDGSLRCWGDNGGGQTDVPALGGGLTYTQVSAGGGHTCGLATGPTTAPPLAAGNPPTPCNWWWPTACSTCCWATRPWAA
jgi:hypothetical protein